MSASDHDERINDAAKYLARYMRGEDRYVRAARELFDSELAETQEHILRAVATNRRVLIVSGNGVGKSYAVALLILGFLYSNPDSMAMLTSGTYSLLEDTTWKPMKSVFRGAKEDVGLPGRTLDSPPKLETEMGDEWYFKAISPTNPGSLEGRHGPDVLVVIEESDKPEIEREHFDSAGSSVTNANDRMVAVANPPEDESNVVHEKMNDDRWEVVQFSSFESHNVRVDMGEKDGDHIPGLVDLPTVAEDYEAWNDEPWPDTPDSWPGAAEMIDAVDAGRLEREKLLEQLRPGVETAREMRDGLDTRWYRRRLGTVPPDDATAPRPWTVADVEDAEARWERTYVGHHRDAIGVDVARKGGDRTAVAEIIGQALQITASRSGLDHTQNEELIGERLDAEHIDGGVAIDAVGEGSAIADTIRRRYSDVQVERFLAGSDAGDDEKYDNARTEALQMLGEWLRGGGAVPPGSDLAEELKSHARYCRYEEHILKDSTVYRATPKDDIKEKLGQSPDYVDAASLAAWAHGGFGKSAAELGSWGSEY